MKVVKAAAVQISPVLYSREATVAKVVQKIHELGQKGVQFATFPETVVPYYPYFAAVQTGIELLSGTEHLRLLEQSVTVPSPATDAIGEAARKAGMVVSIGVNERDGGTIYNTQLLFDADGTLIQRRRKITPTHFERMIWGQGDGSGLRAVDSASRPHWPARMLRAQQPARALRDDRRRRADPLGDVPGLGLRRGLCPAHGNQYPPACARVRLFRRERNGVAGRRPAGANHEGHRLWNRSDLGRLLHHHRRLLTAC